MHVGVGGAGEREVQYLGSDLGPGDEISIRVLTDEAKADTDDAPRGCSFCASEIHHVQSLVSGPQTAICETCLAAIDAVMRRGAPLPLGAFIRQDEDRRCGFCLKGPPEVAGLIVRNDAAVCPECLRGLVDVKGESP